MVGILNPPKIFQKNYFIFQKLCFLLFIFFFSSSSGSRLHELLNNKNDLAKIRMILKPFIEKKKTESQFIRKTDVVRVRRPHQPLSSPSSHHAMRVRFPHFPATQESFSYNPQRFVRNSMSGDPQNSVNVEPFGDFLIEGDDNTRNSQKYQNPNIDYDQLLGDFAKDDLFQFNQNKKDFLFKFTFATKGSKNESQRNQINDGNEVLGDLFKGDIPTSTVKSTSTTTVSSATTTTASTTSQPSTTVATTTDFMIKDYFIQEDDEEDFEEVDDEEQQSEYLTAEQLEDYLIVLPLPFKFLKKDSPLLDRLG